MTPSEKRVILDALANLRKLNQREKEFIKLLANEHYDEPLGEEAVKRLTNIKSKLEAWHE